MTLHVSFKKARGLLLKKRWLKFAVYYFVLFGIGFVFLYPILYMIINSFLSPDDLTDPAVFWIPTGWYPGNFIKAFETLDFLKSFGWSLCMSAGPALLQTAAAAVTGFALARFRLPGQKLWLVLIIATFMIPVQLTTISERDYAKQLGVYHNAVHKRKLRLLAQLKNFLKCNGRGCANPNFHSYTSEER